VTTLSTWIPGVPVPQGSARAFVVGNRAVVTHANKRTVPWRDTIRAHVHNDMVNNNLPLAPRGAVVVMATFVFPRPKGHFGTGRNADALRESAPKWHVTKPDGDKLIRALLDALTGTAYHDDAQVDGIQAKKRYASPGNAPGLDLRLEWLA
jgi:Holliday junction resolvase RusA-like endonuclease